MRITAAILLTLALFTVFMILTIIYAARIGDTSLAYNALLCANVSLVTFGTVALVDIKFGSALS